MSYGMLSEVNHFNQEVSSLSQQTPGILQDFTTNANGFVASNLANPTSAVPVGGVNYDGRRMRNKSNIRKTVDYNASVVNWLHVSDNAFFFLDHFNYLVI